MTSNINRHRCTSVKWQTCRLEVSFIGCVVVLLVSEEEKMVCWLVCGEVTNKSQTCLPHGKLSVCVCVCVCAPHCLSPGEMLLQRHMADTFKMFYKCNSRHCKEQVLNSIQCVSRNLQQLSWAHTGLHLEACTWSKIRGIFHLIKANVWYSFNAAQAAEMSFTDVLNLTSSGLLQMSLRNDLKCVQK